METVVRVCVGEPNADVANYLPTHPPMQRKIYVYST